MYKNHPGFFIGKLLMYNRTMILVFVVVILQFWIKARSFLDPDFGWHLRMGELILQKGIPKTDPFSYSMPSYPFVDHEWLTNVIFASLYHHIGLNGLSFLFMLLALLAIGIQVSFIRSHWVLMPLLLGSLSFMPFLGIRPQVISWVLFSLLLVVILHEKIWQKWRWGLPVLLLLWVNVHGSFPLGIAVIALAIFSRSLRGTKQSGLQMRLPRSRWSLAMTKDWLMVALCFVATLINPYGWRIWWEVWMQMTDPNLHWAVQEWLPALFIFNDMYLMLLPLSVIIVWKYRKKFQPVELALYTALLLMSLGSARHVPFWLLMQLALTSRGLAYLFAEVKRYPMGEQRFRVIAKICMFVVMLVVATDSYMMLPQLAFSQLSRSPADAVSYLKVHPSKGNILNEYGLGGYLIWQYPEKKVFIDGRMPSWRWNCPPQGESGNAFRDYEHIMSGDPGIKLLFEKYKIDTVVLNREEDPETIAAFFRTITPLHLVNKPRLRKQLQKMGMKEVYKDALVVIYRK